MYRADRPVHTSASAYTALQIALYWVSAPLLCSLFTLGFCMTGLAKGVPGKAILISLYKSLGLMAALVIAWRVVVCVSRVASSSTPGLHCWETELTRITHRLLYIRMAVMLVSGYLGSSFNPCGTRFWGVSLPPWGWIDSALQYVFYTVHSTTVGLLFCLVVLHVAGVIKRQRIDEQRYVQHMLPG